MLLGQTPIGAAPLAVSAEETPILLNTIITLDIAEITLSAGDVIVSSGIALLMDQALIVFSSPTATRVGARILPAGADFTLSGEVSIVGAGIAPSVGTVTFTAGAVTVSDLLAATGAEITFEGTSPVIGQGAVPASGEIVFAGGPLTFGDGIQPESALIAFAGGEPAVGSGVVPAVVSITFEGGTPAVGSGIRVPSATIWFTGGVVSEQLEVAQGTVVVLNANTLAVSEYSIAALDVVEHEGALYFVTATGLVKLAADADTDFTAAVQTGALYLAGNKIGVAPRAYVGAKTSAALQLTVSTYSYGATLANDYTAPVPVASTSRAQVVPLGKGAEAEAWQFKIDSVAPGASWDLASLEVVVSPIKRPRS